ncbi:MAG: prepilin-type N-terminal cleavage/methylation protein [Proteobacteria bacterium]|nr:prepilin-type N-terminal cleavage/methylation protein [Pseudomonadota bacterium]
MTFAEQKLPMRSKQSGVTLVELVIAIAIFAILLAMAVPSFESLIASTRVSTTTNDLLAALAQARSEAIRRGQRVTICASANGAQCANAGSWNQGWIIFTDGIPMGLPNAAPPNAIVDNGETILSVAPATPANIAIQGQAAVGQYVSFASNGQSRTIANATQTGTIEVCTTSQTISDLRRARDLIISASGQVIMQSPTLNPIPNNCPNP